MTELVIAQLISTIGAVTASIIAGITSIRVKRAREDTQAILRQTENSHEESDYPNLRDELTAVRKGQERGFEMVEQHISDVDRSGRSTRSSLERHLEEADQAIEKGAIRLSRLEASVRELKEREHE